MSPFVQNPRDQDTDSRECEQRQKRGVARATVGIDPDEGRGNGDEKGEQTEQRRNAWFLVLGSWFLVLRVLVSSW
jgi:hypothetical protein